MTKRMKRAAAAFLALTMLTGTAASASDALGHDIHSGGVGLAPGTGVDFDIFWSDTYSDLRTENYLSYAPSRDVIPTMAYGWYLTSRDTLTGMAKRLEDQGKRVVGGINGGYYSFSTGAPDGIVISDGVLRSAPSADSASGSGGWYWGIGFQEDGSAFIGQPKISIRATFHGAAHSVTGGLNKVRGETNGYVLLNSDFATTTQNTSPGVDVILTPVTTNVGQTVAREDGIQLTQSDAPTVMGRMSFTVDKVQDSSSAIAIPAGKYVLTVNNKSGAASTSALKALSPGDTVDIDFTSPDSRWADAVEATGAPSRLVKDGAVDSASFSGDSNAKTRRARTAIGIKPDGTVLFYTIDGEQSGYSVGCTLQQVAMRLIELGCTEAVALDGGGSTTLGATYPGQSTLGVVNKPSGGSQRSNSTALFLTTTLSATGTLGSYYVKPSDAMVLSGSSVQLSATPLDTAYYPMTSSEPVDWYIQNGDGIVTADGLFTAGSESGTTQVTAASGKVSGTTTMTVVKTPQTITVSNAATGKTVTSLDAAPKQQVDLKASATYRKLALVSQDTSYTWTCTPAVGTIDPNGVFTAASSAASGSITVSAGGKSISIPVSIAGHTRGLENFEEGVSAFSSTSSASLSVETAQSYVKYGRQSARLTYDVSSGSVRVDSALELADGETQLSLWVYGDRSGNVLSAQFTGSDGEQSVPLTALDFSGWKAVSVPIPAGASTLSGIGVTGGGSTPTGTVWLDQLATANQQVTDTTAPTVTVKRSGTQLTASVSDNLTKYVPASYVTVTYDGKAIDKTWNAGTASLTATLPASEGKAHRITVTASDAAGNLARSSVDIAPDADYANVFADMDGHWGAKAASYLYTSGVTSGTGEAGSTLTYAPDRNITRGEFFALTARWLGLDLDQYAGTALPFADADQAPAWALPEIRAMYALGILSGSESGGKLYLNAGANISRVEVMTILGRTQAKGYPTPALTASDASSVPAWAADYVRSLVGQGVVSGYGGKISPNKTITRAEVAAMLYAMD
ncbi:phosphodiester glycosidase family protein [Pseudoflavonifractor sp. MSJ-37]|uniref:phosphodiester glycosidase family protein n=1 Tax=Pseudoflavonifractor sp. MSJ-37 TaxID=2841531 RepID=UPI001C127951|nr:phosphodiester glycosidase family protein [Pseudoflavonifractor sp. MSJ-37]MBU5435987.1 phosphodiester glycosidase family protein [Pseudoflavonifractor sp. MSJ-37]